MQRNPTKSQTPASGNTLMMKGTWSKVLPTKFSTETTSCTFLKKLVTVAVSNIIFLRTMFPDTAYANKAMDVSHLRFSSPRVTVQKLTR